MAEPKPMEKPTGAATSPQVEKPEKPKTGEGAVKCDSCGKEFSNQGELQAHIGRRHSQESQPATTPA